ncbi:MAG: hypothetical protein V4647_05685 [Pseudomonadota bacterium]
MSSVATAGSDIWAHVWQTDLDPADVPDFIMGFVHLKEWLEATSGLTRDAMHVHIGLAIYLGLTVILRGRGGWWLPVSLLVALSLVAEVFDVISLLSVKSPIYPEESVRDVTNTLLWPVVLSWLQAWQRRQPGRR